MHTQQLQPSAHLREVVVIDRASAPVGGGVIHELFILNIIAIERDTAFRSKLESGVPLEFFLFLVGQ